MVAQIARGRRRNAISQNLLIRSATGAGAMTAKAAAANRLVMGKKEIGQKKKKSESSSARGGLGSQARPWGAAMWTEGRVRWPGREGAAVATRLPLARPATQPVALPPFGKPAQQEAEIGNLARPQASKQHVKRNSQFVACASVEEESRSLSQRIAALPTTGRLLPPCPARWPARATFFVPPLRQARAASLVAEGSYYRHQVPSAGTA